MESKISFNFGSTLSTNPQKSIHPSGEAGQVFVGYLIRILLIKLIFNY